MKKFILIFTLIILSAKFSIAQGQKNKDIPTQAPPPNTTQASVPLKSFQIKGMVVDSISGSGLPYVTIGVQDQTQAVIKRLASDTNGKFDFSLNVPGKYNMIIQSIGYAIVKKEFTLMDRLLPVTMISITRSRANF